jgi:hypothetical protein
MDMFEKLMKEVLGTDNPFTTIKVKVVEEETKDAPTQAADDLIKSLAQDRDKYRKLYRKWKKRASYRLEYLNELLERHERLRTWIAAFVESDKEVIQEELWNGRLEKVVGIVNPWEQDNDEDAG